MSASVTIPRRGFLSSMLKAGVVTAFLPSAVTYARTWSGEVWAPDPAWDLAQVEWRTCVMPSMAEDGFDLIVRASYVKRDGQWAPTDWYGEWNAPHEVIRVKRVWLESYEAPGAAPAGYPVWRTHILDGPLKRITRA